MSLSKEAQKDPIPQTPGPPTSGLQNYEKLISVV